jgi:AhpD family alkylhydroperoxidase
MMTPKLLLTVLKTYTTAMAPGAFEHFDAEAIETVYAAVSSSNNCEMCLSFHAMALGASASAEDIAEIVAGGLPKDPKMRTLVIASKYALAHKGIYLERERKHLAMLGIEGEKLVELTFLVGFMSAHNMNYVHLISMGLELEPMLQEVGPFAKTIYAKEGEL